MTTETFTKVPDWLAQRTEISVGAKLVWARLKRYAGSGWITEETPMGRLGADLGLSLDTVQRRVMELRTHRLVHVDLHRHKCRGSVYTVVAREDWKAEARTKSLVSRGAQRPRPQPQTPPQNRVGLEPNPTAESREVGALTSTNLTAESRETSPQNRVTTPPQNRVGEERIEKERKKRGSSSTSVSGGSSTSNTRGENKPASSPPLPGLQDVVAEPKRKAKKASTAKHAGFTAVRDAYFRIFEATKGEKPLDFKPIDGKAINDLLDAVGGDTEKAIAIIDRALRDPFTGTRTTIREIGGNPNKFIKPRTAPTRNGAPKQPPIEGRRWMPDEAEVYES